MVACCARQSVACGFSVFCQSTVLLRWFRRFKTKAEQDICACLYHVDAWRSDAESQGSIAAASFFSRLLLYYNYHVEPVLFHSLFILPSWVWRLTDLPLHCCGIAPGNPKGAWPLPPFLPPFQPQLLSQPPFPQLLLPHPLFAFGAEHVLGMARR